MTLNLTLTFKIGRTWNIILVIHMHSQRFWPSFKNSDITYPPNIRYGEFNCDMTLKVKCQGHGENQGQILKITIKSIFRHFICTKSFMNGFWGILSPMVIWPQKSKVKFIQKIKAKWWKLHLNSSHRHIISTKSFINVLGRILSLMVIWPWTSKVKVMQKSKVEC